MLKWFTSFFKTNEEKNNNTNEEENNNTNEEENNNDNTIDIKDEINNNKNEDNTQQEIVSSVFTSIIEGVKILMASLLAVFVPQYCETSGTTCTFEENFKDLTQYNEFVLFINFLTLGFFSYLIYIQNKREAYLISHLDSSKYHPPNSLETNIKMYPRILIRVRQYNKKLEKFKNITVCLFSFNVLFSSILIFHYYYDGFRSVTTLLGHLLLVSSKLYHLHHVCEESNTYKTNALSSIHHTYISYNIPDKKYDIYGIFYKENKGIQKSKNRIQKKIYNKRIKNRFLKKVKK